MCSDFFFFKIRRAELFWTRFKCCIVEFGRPGRRALREKIKETTMFGSAINRKIFSIFTDTTKMKVTGFSSRGHKVLHGESVSNNYSKVLYRLLD